MGAGDLSAEAAKHSGVLSSKNDEVSRLQSAIEDYETTASKQKHTEKSAR